MRYHGDFGELVAFILVTLILSLTVNYGWTMATTKRACLRSGYPDAKVSFAFEPYCVKRLMSEPRKPSGDQASAPSLEEREDFCASRPPESYTVADLRDDQCTGSESED